MILYYSAFNRHVLTARRGYKLEQLVSSTVSGEYTARRCVRMYAIIETGGKQYKVAEGDVITVEKLGVEAESAFVFDKVLAVSDDAGLTVGAPYVSGAAVSASVIGDGKEKKVIIYKYKPKKGFHKKKGHRQPFTKLQINKISVI